MKSLLQLSLRFATLGVLTVLVFFGGLIARLIQTDPEAKNKIAKNFGVNTAHADFTTTTVEGFVEGTSSEVEGACESAEAQGEAQGEADGPDCC